jgi:hypothetical protein
MLAAATVAEAKEENRVKDKPHRHLSYEKRPDFRQARFASFYIKVK